MNQESILKELLKRGNSIKLEKGDLLARPGYIKRTDGVNVDKHINMLFDLRDKGKVTDAFIERNMSVLDLSQQLYDHFCDNPNSMYNWFPFLENAMKKYYGKNKIGNAQFLIPKTTIRRLPIEIAQILRIDYKDLNQTTRDSLNKLIFDLFKLENGKTYFIKTGTFSNKFVFQNCKCEEPEEMGEYFVAINNKAMEVGAGLTVDYVVREYIEDHQNRPTIYHGMPLRTEFRAFYDFDKKELIGVAPYWHPVLMKKYLGLSCGTVQDYETFLKWEDIISDDFNDSLYTVRKEISEICSNFSNGFRGKWSIDVMKNCEDEYYVIDMATYETSALTEYAV